MTAAVLAALLLVVVACGGNDDQTSPSRPVTVFAAASLAEGFTDAQAELHGLDVSFTFAGSQALVAQIQQGASADVFASADQATMQKLVDDGLVEAPQVFARNKLVIAVEPGNPKDVTRLADLARGDLAVVLADPSVPVGNYAKQVLDRAGVSVSPQSLELDPKAALAKVMLGEADAAMVYVTDVAAVGTKATGVEIPDAENVIATYPIAVVKGTTHRAAAEAFVAAALDGAVQDALRKRGFLPSS